ncbi:MAG: tryptophan synthase subunit alpha [Deltaproteobacteria bacterium]|nr:MAG: tryptophan synthase subunit alpha [Deltaproteobacteria bacterium]
MSRLSDAFPRGRTALVCYVMAGDPSLASTEELLLAIDGAGADVIELGLPFSDPIADGPTLQASATRSLKHGGSVASALSVARKLRGKLRAPVVTMGYMNPIESMGLRGFAAALRDAGIAGCIVPDLPLEEAAPLREELDAAGVDLVPLVAPTTPMERAAAIAKLARGFVYTVSVTGVTGARTEFPPDLAARLRELRAISSLPVAVGFGIARPVQAAALRGLVDGIVVGSALVAAHHEGGVAKATELVRGLKAALQ